jgi:hypothetical protein
MEISVKSQFTPLTGGLLLTVRLLAGAVFLLPALYLVLKMEGEMGLRTNWTMNALWLKEYFIPWPYWTLGMVYFGLARAFSTKPARFLPYVQDLLIIHIGILLIQALNQRVADGLASAAFQYYCQAYIFVLLGGITSLSAKRLGELFKGYGNVYAAPIAIFPIGFFFLKSPLYLGPVLFLAAIFYRWSADKKNWLFEKREKWIILGIVLMGLAIRLFAAWRLGQMGNEILLVNSDDGDSYFANAKRLLAGEAISNHHSIGAAALLAIFYKITGYSLPGTLLLQAFVASLLPLLAYKIVKDLWGTREALLGSFFIAFSQVIIFNSINLTREFGGSLFLVVFAFVLLWTWNRQLLGKSILFPALFLGLVAGILVTFEVVFQALLIVAYVFLILRSRGAARTNYFLSMIIFLAVSTSATWLITGHALARDKATLDELMSRYSHGGSLLVEKHLHPMQFVLEPAQALTGLWREGSQGLALIGKKLNVDFKLYYFGGFLGGFDPLLLERHSAFASSINFYLVLFIFIGLVFAVKEVLNWSKVSGPTLILLLLCFGHGIFYATFLAGWARFRGTVLPLFCLFLALGIMRFFTGTFPSRRQQGP